MDLLRQVALLIMSLCLGVLSVKPHGCFADESQHPDHEMARRLVQSGEILPLERILDNDRVRGRDLLEVELENKHGVYLYEIELVDANGHVLELIFDAKTGKMVYEKQE